MGVAEGVCIPSIKDRWEKRWKSRYSSLGHVGAGGR